MDREISFDFVAICKCGDLSQLADRSKTILVISPHPDDDVIGMGGAMRLMAGDGKKIFSAYVTHGGSAASRRRNEALAALKIIKASGAFFLNHASRELAGTAAAKVVRQLQKIITLLKPVEIFMPSPFERHPTHRLVTRITLRALNNMGNAPRAWGYSVWGGVYGLPGTKVVDISEAVRAKRKAIRQHASQTCDKPYDAGILGRNAYDGIFMETHARSHMSWAETFIDINRLKKWVGTDILIRAIASCHSP